jgi:signal transduction histidine kinase/ABC-type branched-subunit amino acid transport system ATPase component
MLDVSGLTVGFGSTTALEAVDLTVAAGELVVLSGEPGAGKTALIRAVAGDLAPASGRIAVGGRALSDGPQAAERLGVAVVWQELALCDNLDVAANLLLGRETSRLMQSAARFHAAAAAMLEQLGIDLPDTGALAGTLPGDQRRMLALAMALSRKPRLLLLDEPTAVLGVAETRQVESFVRGLCDTGVAVLLATRDIGQMFRVAERVVVLREGRVVATLAPSNSHPDDVAALLAGQRPDASARQQLTRLHGLADSLALADPASGLSMIVAALAAALGVERGDVQIVAADGTVADGRVTVSGALWTVPVHVGGSRSAAATITVARESAEPPTADEMDLLVLYAGYAGAAIERQEAEAAGREAAALRRTRELQRQFLSRLSHELRTPLTAIRGYASSLATPDISWDEPSQQRFLERIAAESARLGRLVDDLLDFSAIESGVLRLQRDWCELELVVEAAIACLPPADAAAVTVVVSPELPPIWADHDRLEQVFVNLLSNATRHNPAGTQVRVAAAVASDETVLIAVGDNGPGFPSELRAAPFDASARPRSRTAGAGVGLSITRGIVHAHGGTIALRTGETGTTFEIELPIEDTAAPSIDAALLGADHG